MKHDGTSISGLDTETDNELTTNDANQKAIEALQLLLRKLPHKLPFKDNSIRTTDDDKVINTQHISQYNIPNDPNQYIPKFKPMKSSVTSTYSFQLGPLEQVTKHTYGGNDYGRKHIEKIISGPELHTHLIPPSIESISTTFKSQALSSHHSHSHAIDAQPLDLYHTMTIKNVGDHSNHPHRHLHSQLPLPYLPPQKRQTALNPHQSEIQKSVEYQLH